MICLWVSYFKHNLIIWSSCFQSNPLFICAANRHQKHIPEYSWQHPQTECSIYTWKAIWKAYRRWCPISLKGLVNDFITSWILRMDDVNIHKVGDWSFGGHHIVFVNSFSHIIRTFDVYTFNIVRFRESSFRIKYIDRFERGKDYQPEHRHKCNNSSRSRYKAITPGVA